MKIKLLLFLFAYLFFGSLNAQKSTLDSLSIVFKKANNSKNDTLILRVKYLIASNLQGANPDSSILISAEINKEIQEKYYKNSVENILEKLKRSNRFPSKTELFYLSLLGDNFHSLAIAHDIKGSYNSSLSNNFKALKIWNYLFPFNKRKFLSKKASSYGNIGILFEELGDNSKALFYFNKCLSIKDKLGDKRGVALTYGSIGTVHYFEKDTEKASYYYQKALDIFLEINDENNASAYLGNLAVVMIDKKAYQHAIELLVKGLKIDQKLNKKKGEASKLGNLGFAYLKIKDYSKAEKYLHEALRVSSSMNLISLIPDHHQFLSEMYEKIGQDKKALFHFKKYITFNDSVKNDEIIRTQTRLEAEFEFEKKQDLQKKEQEKQRALLLAEKNKQVYINLFLVSLFCLFVVLVMFAINFTRKRQKQLKLQSAKRQLEIEYKLLRAQMNPHFIFNVLNSIHQYINQVNNELASTLLLKFSKLIRQILQHSTLEEIPLNEEIDQINLYISIEEIRFSNQFSTEIIIDSKIKTEEILIPTMILQPFIENAIIHGLSPLKDRKGKLKIEICMISKSHIEVRIEDNGNGFSKKDNISSSHESLSMKLIEERLQILDSKQFSQIKIEDSKPGTRIIVKIPIQSIF